MMRKILIKCLYTNNRVNSVAMLPPYANPNRNAPMVIPYDWRSLPKGEKKAASTLNEVWLKWSVWLKTFLLNRFHGRARARNPSRLLRRPSVDLSFAHSIHTFRCGLLSGDYAALSAVAHQLPCKNKDTPHNAHFQSAFSLISSKFKCYQ